MTTRNANGQSICPPRRTSPQPPQGPSQAPHPTAVAPTCGGPRPGSPRPDPGSPQAAGPSPQAQPQGGGRSYGQESAHPGCSATGCGCCRGRRS
jgi:hypothetical protein